MDKKSTLLVFSGYVMWGFQPLYWGLLGQFNPMFNLAMRILWSVVFMACVLFAARKSAAFKAVITDRKKLKFIMLGTLFLLMDLIIYMDAVQTGHVLDAALGYYMGPFVTFSLSMLLFKEKPRPLAIAAMATALIGVAVSIIQYGKFSYISVLLAILFVVYGAFKKLAAVEPIVSYSVEMALMAPLAILYLVLFPANIGGTISVTALLLFAGTGVVTCLPMILYALGVLKLPFVMMGFMQYVSPSLGLICGLIMGEVITIDKLVTFLFIWAAMTLYMVSMARDERKRSLESKAVQNAAAGAA